MIGRVARGWFGARRRARAGLAAWMRAQHRAELAAAAQLLAVWQVLPAVCLALGATALLLQALGYDGVALLLLVGDVLGLGLYLGAKLTLVALAAALPELRRRQGLSSIIARPGRG